MCLNHINIVNRSKRLEFSPSTSFRFDVPCGNCCECQSLKYNEYLFRAYYHTLGVVASGGYCYFDTLTYSDSNLPTFSKVTGFNISSDFPCFSRLDVRLFFVRLRRSLSRAGYDVKDNLSYFLTSEYGTSELHTHRPHYHVLFFVCFPIDPVEFSKFVSSSWKLGRTDGVPFKSAYYVYRHTYGHSNYSQPLLKLVNYVCKYVVKSSQFKEELSKRINIVIQNESSFRSDFAKWLSIKYNKDVSIDSVDTKYVRSFLYRLCSEFHLQSNGFGAYALSQFNKDQLLKDGYFTFWDPKKIKRTIPIPLYFQRKLFYKLVTDFRGLLHWELNSDGVRYKYLSKLKSIDTFTDKFTCWLHSLSESDLTYASSLLSGRSIRSFVEYLLFYKGRLKPANLKIQSLDAWIVRFTEHSDTYIYNYTDKKDFGIPLLSYRWFGDRQSNTLLSSSYYRNYKAPFCDCCSFERQFVINQNSLPEFHSYDDLFSFYFVTNISRNQLKQSASDAIDRLRLLFT